MKARALILGALVLRAITQVGGILVRPGVVDHTVAGYTLLESHAQSPAIAAVLTEESGSVEKAAKRLGVTRNTLYYKMRKHGIR